MQITSENTPRHPHAIFVSAGDRETFATYALDNLTDTFDIIIFQYGSSPEKRARFAQDARVFLHGPGTKFGALRQIFIDRPDILESYETIWVCDDDLILEHGDYRVLPLVQRTLGVRVLSPAHSIKGKISHQIMLPKLGRHFFRHTSFVEMTCPLFATEALFRFLGHYDGSLRGYAEEWWFLSVLGAKTKGVAGIVDSVTIINPHNKQKSGGFGEMELQGERSVVRLHWLAAMEKYGMKEWPAETFSYVRDERREFQRPLGDVLRTSAAMLDYNLRFYNLRKRVHRTTKTSGRKP